MSDHFRASPPAATRSALPPAPAPPPVYPPLWWLRPFLAGLLLGLSLLAVELMLHWSEDQRRQALERNDKIQQEYAPRRAP